MCWIEVREGKLKAKRKVRELSDSINKMYTGNKVGNLGQKNEESWSFKAPGDESGQEEDRMSIQYSLDIISHIFCYTL